MAKPVKSGKRAPGRRPQTGVGKPKPALPAPAKVRARKDAKTAADPRKGRRADAEAEKAARASNAKILLGQIAPRTAPDEVAAIAPAAPAPPETTTEELWGRYRSETARAGNAGSAVLDHLRNQLIERHYPLVRYIAERLLQTLPKSIELDDLISAGLFGLMDAIRGFDQSRGIKFKTYCSTRVRGSILDQLRSQDWVPRLVRLKAGRIEKALARLTGEFGREPTHAELARCLEMDHHELVQEMEEARAKTMFSLSEKWEDDDDGALEKVEILEDRAAVDPIHELNKRDLMQFITRSLTDKERFIIRMYYERGLTMREIGEILALTESRVCQIHSNVMFRLKEHLDRRQDQLLP
jgi:RNA polymerase sigma factor for flagellar operon FliA